MAMLGRDVELGSIDVTITAPVPRCDPDCGHRHAAAYRG
jgi:hypothetical protein